MFCDKSLFYYLLYLYYYRFSLIFLSILVDNHLKNFVLDSQI